MLMMEDRKVNGYKRKFDRQLRHVKLILMSSRAKLPSEDWIRLVYATKKSVINNPEQYLNGEIPDRKILILSIERVFKGFLEDQKIRDSQKRL
jgi:hypothetical protein